MDRREERHMPMIVFEGSAMDAEKKAELVRCLTDEASRITGIDKQAFVVFIHENPMENIGTGGAMLADVLAGRGSR
jgi:4-oxalocrotonate tautomerase